MPRSAHDLRADFGIARKVAKKYRVLPEAWWTKSEIADFEAGLSTSLGTSHVGEEWE